MPQPSKGNGGANELKQEVPEVCDVGESVVTSSERAGSIHGRGGTNCADMDTSQEGCQNQ